jgi:hypothetical protein
MPTTPENTVCSLCVRDKIDPPNNLTMIMVGAVPAIVCERCDGEVLALNQRNDNE